MNATTRGGRRQVVLVADQLSSEGVALLRERPELDVRVLAGAPDSELLAAAIDADAILVRSGVRVTASLIAAAPRLSVVGRAGIGVDNVDVAAATARGVLVMNCPDANADTTAEHTLALLFALARFVPQADRALRAGRFDRKKFVGVELQGKVLGILGGGNVGRRVARRARALGMEPIVHDPNLAHDALRDYGATVLPLEVVLAKSEFLSIHVPLSEQTRRWIDATMISRMKDGVRIVNCARGGIVDEDALVAALRSGKVAAAAIDVFEREPPPTDHPLLSLENVIATPHLGASTHEAQARASLEICRQTIAWLLDGEVRNAVNLPRLSGSAWRAVSPWLDLGRRLGRLLSGLAPAEVAALEVVHHGTVAEFDGAAILRAVAAGFAASRSKQTVNEVNSPEALAKLGVELTERRSPHMRDFAGMLVVHAHHASGRTTVGGALFGHRQPRVVRIDEHSLEALIEGVLLVVRNDDRPGVVGKLGTILGEAAVNIRAMHLSPPRRPGGEALAVLNLDSAASPAAIERVRAIPEVRSAAVVSVGAADGA